MTVLDARQLGAGACARRGVVLSCRRPAWCRGLLLGQLPPRRWPPPGSPGRGRGLLRGERLALHAEAQALVVRQLQGQRLDLGVGGAQFGVAARNDGMGGGNVFPNQLRHRFRQGGIGHDALQFSVQFHAGILLAGGAPNLLREVVPARFVVSFRP